MLTSQQDNSIDNILKPISWIVSFIFFGISFFQTGKGLEILFSWQYLGFILSFAILLGLVFCYTLAVHKRKAWLWGFIFFAFVNFFCNLNAFYPNMMVDTLIRNELKAHRENYAALSENIYAAFLDTKLVNLESAVDAKLMQLQKQILQDGLGDKSKAIITELNTLLGTNLTLLKTERGNSASWQKTADAYKEMINSELKAKIEKNDNNSKVQLVKDTESLKDTIFPEIDSVLNAKNKIEFPINQNITELMNNIVKNYTIHCITAHRLKPNFNCNEKYFSENSEIGKFSHTLPSALKYLSEFNTIIVILICFAIDFFFPSLAYLYLKNHNQDNNIPSRFRWFWQPKDIEHV
ncbi:hypothetical protein B0F87_107152 [Methylobacter tundripaludum]|uniref:Uncharacterized protein n=1 Tax=Methylobacter tundripaludum TaxID=173365 RepID=A0A2S6HBQ5_9GAMM|nr:hypothetical protein [Methylobacter tundripaludum]PPK74909.1 hypothetical protein B0F87_107152 [Methylobacter tundripaludum]